LRRIGALAMPIVFSLALGGSVYLLYDTISDVRLMQNSAPRPWLVRQH
jgi:hypothetical protein